MMDEQDYLLTCVIEELSECIKEISKIKRFGADDHHPDTPNISNVVRANREFDDLCATMDLLSERTGLKIGWGENCDDTYEKKREKLLKFMEYSRKKGTLR